MTSTLVINLEATAEQVGDRWRVVQDALGLYAYGDTSDEAYERIRIAADLYVETIMNAGGPQAVIRRMEQAGIDVDVLEQLQEPRTLPLLLTLAKSYESV